MTNLDFLCMKTGQAMVEGEGPVKDKENVTTKGLGVLLENGPYGLVLYLQTAKSDIAKHYLKELVGLCGEERVAIYLGKPAPLSQNLKEIAAWLRELAQELDRYLFVKGLWEQSLTYARYHAKALDDGGDSGASEAQEERE